jgi:hypothetical protein
VRETPGDRDRGIEDLPERAREPRHRESEKAEGL